VRTGGRPPLLQTVQRGELEKIFEKVTGPANPGLCIKSFKKMLERKVGDFEGATWLTELGPSKNNLAKGDPTSRTLLHNDQGSPQST